jgi:ParB family chromosome partitioning protein
VTPAADDVARVRKEAAGQARATPPVAQVAGEAADAHGRALGDALAQAAAYARADADGRVLRELPLDSVEGDYLRRDRLADDAAALAELKASIREHGLRTAIEVVPLSDVPDRFGLISGWRRLAALRALHAETAEPRFATVKAVLSRPETIGDAYVAMVEENEVRADISFYERGRICVVATEQGVFPDVAAAVDTLFAAASPAKRSKIRTFARLHVELGPALRFPTTLGERLGLRLVEALQAGAAARLQGALEPPAADAEAEQASLVAALDAFEAARSRTRPTGPRRGRPRRAPNTVLELGPALRLERHRAATGLELRLTGEGLTDDVAETAVRALRRALAAGETGGGDDG